MSYKLPVKEFSLEGLTKIVQKINALKKTKKRFVVSISDGKGGIKNIDSALLDD